MKCNTLKKYASGFTVVDNSIIKNTKLSPKAIGIWVQLLTLPNNWNFSKKGLTGIINAGERSIDTGLEELTKANLFYIQKKKPTQEKPYIYYDYFIFELPNKEEINRLKIEELKDFPQKPLYVGVQNVGLHNQGVQNVGLHDVGLQKSPPYKECINKECINKELINKKNKQKDFYDLILKLNIDRQSIFKEWLAYKKSKNQSYTEIGLKKLIATMEEFSDTELRAALDNSISNNYSGIFPKHENKPKGGFYRADANTPKEVISQFKVMEFGEDD